MNGYDNLPLDELKKLKDLNSDDTLEELKTSAPELEPESAQKRKPTNDAVMYWMCLDCGVEAFRTLDTDGVFVRFPIDGHFEIASVRSRRFQAWLTDKFYTTQQQKVPGKTDIDKVVSLLEAQAHKSPKRRTFTRVARVEGKIYVDLCDDLYRVVEVDENGWRVIEDSPVLFIRSSSMLPLPAPTEGGSLEQLREFARNMHDDDFMLLVSWLVAVFNPDGPFPLLAIVSEHGSGKSTLTTLLKKLIDPDIAPRLGAFKDANDLFAGATARWVVAVDNQSKITEDISDAFCRISTGGGNSKRALFTDNDSFTCNIMRPMILNGIVPSLGKPDLLDRIYLVELSPISHEKRRTEMELYAAFDKVRPGILGALLSAVSCTLKQQMYVPKRLPRMADGAAFIMQAEKGGGFPWKPGEFYAMLERKESEKRADVLLNDPVAIRIVPLAQGNGWTGTMRDLLAKIKNSCNEEEYRFMPALPNGLSRKLKEITPFLREIGIHVEILRRTKAGSKVRISGKLKLAEEAFPEIEEPEF